MAVVQQAGIGLGIVGDGKGWSGGSTRPDGEANQPQRIKERRPKVFLEITLNKKKLGNIVIELFGEVVPKTVENFRCLCTGERGVSGVSGRPLHYKGSTFHKIIPGKCIQGGDYTKGDGSGGDSIYNQDTDGTFPDENYKLKHDRPALISMLHKKNDAGKNSSLFFFTSKAEPKMDGQNVVFGRVIQGVDIMSKVEATGTQSGKPMYEATISDCGELDTEAKKMRKRKGGEEEEPLPPGWEKKESRSKPGLFYYQHEGSFTQFERPTSRARDPLAMAAELSKRRRLEAELSKEKALPDRACSEDEVRLWHIVKKHKDFFGKSAKSWRCKEISLTKKEVSAALQKLKDKCFNVGYGGGTSAMQKKFENFARMESDDEVSAKMGGDLGPVTKKKRLFGSSEISKVGFALKLGTMSELIETTEGVHLIARFE